MTSYFNNISQLQNISNEYYFPRESHSVGDKYIKTLCWCLWDESSENKSYKKEYYEFGGYAGVHISYILSYDIILLKEWGEHLAS